MRDNFRPTVIRNRAWDALTGKWGTAAVAFLVSTACMSTVMGLLVYMPLMIGAVGVAAAQGASSAMDAYMGAILGNDVSPLMAPFVLFSNLGQVLSYLVIGPLTIGAMFLFLDVSRGREVSIPTMFEPFRKYGRYLGAYLWVGLLTFLWMLLLIVPGIVKSISYSMTFFIMRDNPEMGAEDARRRSMEMMEGHKWEYFCLQLSFIGWIFLGVITCCIGLLWVYPYIYTANAEFYEELKRERHLAAVL